MLISTARLRLQIDCESVVAGPSTQGGATGIIVAQQEPQVVVRAREIIRILTKRA